MGFAEAGAGESGVAAHETPARLPFPFFQVSSYN